MTDPWKTSDVFFYSTLQEEQSIFYGESSQAALTADHTVPIPTGSYRILDGKLYLASIPIEDVMPAALRKSIERVVGAENLAKWLATPVPMLGNQTPAALISMGEIDAIEGLLSMRQQGAVR